MPVIAASEADAEGDAEEARTSTVAATAGASRVIKGVQVAEETKGSIVELLPMPEERVKGDHAEGVLQQCKQFECKLRVTSMDHTLPVAKEVVARALGEDSDMQEVSGASAMVAVVDLDTMEGVQMTADKTVPRQG